MKSIALVVPTRGRSALVNQCLEAMSIAVRRNSTFQLVIADNNVDDECSRELERFSDRATIVRTHASTVGAARNDGVKTLDPSVEIVCFVDSDCLVPEDFLERVDRAFSERTDDVIGCKVMSPADGHWTEVVSDALHRDGDSGPRQALNSGCMAVRRSAFLRVGGFSVDLPSNEDYDLCTRLRLTGSTIWQDQSLAIVHLGNPKSARGYFKRMLWHGRGVVDSRGRVAISRMLFFVLANAALIVLGLIFVAFASFSATQTSLVLLTSLTFAPLTFVALRMLQFRRYIPIVPSMMLMQITFCARLVGLISELRVRHSQR